MKAIVAYYRVTTKKKGASRSELEVQKTAVESYCRQHGVTIGGEYREMESGKHCDRPQLSQAVAHAKRSKATLVIAKLDRLTRNVPFLTALLEAGCEFVACDNPHANRLTIHILAAIAEHESRMFSDRMKAALEAAKRRGVKLGSHRPGHWIGHEQARRDGAKKAAKAAGKIHQQAADEAYADLYAILADFRQQGQTLRQIAGQLNKMGHTTRRGKTWNASQVLRVLRRAA